MARVIPFDFIVDPGEIIYLTRLDEVDNPVNTLPMTCASATCSSPQCMVDQRPAYDRKRKKGRRANQVIGKAGVIRPDKRQKAKYL